MSIEKLSDFEPGRGGVVKRWLEELRIAEEWERPWRERAQVCIDRYEGECTHRRSTFNILYSNVETIRPALYANRPIPDIRRRRKAPAQLEREAAEILERCLEYMIDTSPYSDEVNAMLNDYLLTGRGVMRVRYKPTILRAMEPVQALDLGDGASRFFTANNNEVEPDDVVETEAGPMVPIESVAFERADVEHVHWRDFRHQPAKKWSDVRWIAFRHEFTRTELEEAFGKSVAVNTQLTIHAERKADDRGGTENPDLFMKAEVWEIWDKADRKILFVSPGNPDRPLLAVDDGPEYYNLADFFCCPAPLLSIKTPNSLLPIPEYTIYQDLARQLDELTARAEGIAESLRVTGVYDGAMPELSQILDFENTLVPVDNFRDLIEKGGLKAVVDFVPLDGPVATLVAIYQQMQVVKQTIYEVVGISDIARAASDPRETATAQRLKAAYGNARINVRQREIQYYLRALMKIQGELIAEKFEPAVISAMAGTPVPEPVLMLYRSDSLRNFAIDIETDSTVATERGYEQEQLSQLLQGIGAYAQAAQALPEGARLPLLQSVIRKFGLGRDVELALEAASEQPPAPDPQAIADQQKAQVEMAKLQQKEGESMRNYQLKLQELALEAQELGLKADEVEAQMTMALGDMLDRD